MGLNNRQHAQETGNPIPPVPRLFNKNNNPEALAAWRRGVSRYIEPGRTIIAETRPELSWRNPKRQDLAPYVVLLRRWIAPFRDSDYENYLKNDYLPLLKKADGAGISSRLWRSGQKEIDAGKGRLG